jgi:hypothetical protein
MLCEFCEKAEVIEGTVDPVSFVPERKKWFARGVYGISATVCPKCGRLSNFSLDTKYLEKILKK